MASAVALHPQRQAGRMQLLTDPGPSPGEIGGIFAGIIALLATIGGGIRWLLGWKDRRELSRADKLEAWQKELKAERTQLDADRAAFHTHVEEQLLGVQRGLEARLDTLEKENRAWRLGFELVSSRLRIVAPADPALEQSARILAAAIPFDAAMTADMEGLLKVLGREPGQSGKAE